ncbi:MAG: penicillin-binding protein [Thermodesulfobacteriota bacterium]
MKVAEQKWPSFRLIFLLIFLSLLFLIIFFRAFQLQVLKSSQLARLAERQYQRIVPLIPKRGILYDRRREEMAISMEVDSVFAQPKKIKDIGEAALKIGRILGKKPAELRQKLKEEKPFVWIQRWITPAQRLAIEDLRIEGIHFLKEAKRFYPHGEMGAHIIGISGLDSKGLEGVELGYDEFLRGEPGYILIPKDGLGRSIISQNPDFRRAEEGCELILTIDKNIQYIAEKELKKAVQACSAKGGMVLVMEPKSGEILAMAVQPSFNPNHFQAYHPELFKNRIITDTFEPGSTFKTFLLAAILEEGVASPRELFFCENGSYHIGGKVIHDSHKYGWLTMADVIKVSSNIGASKLGKKLGKEKFYHYLKEFGFGKNTGIDLPGEVQGFLPPYSAWSEVGLANISFGQGVSLTALQLTVAMAAIANKGMLMRPYIAKVIQSKDGGVIRENRPKMVKRVISPHTANSVTAILKLVTQEGGTGRAAYVPGYEVAGKTGTAQKALISGRGYSDKRIGSFMGFAPADDPRVVISVIIDEPERISYGGVVAAPAFRAIAEQVLPYIGVYPKGVTYLAQASHSPREQLGSVPKYLGTESAKKDTDSWLNPGIMPDFHGKSMRQVLQMAQKLGLELKLVGTGRAVAQTPSPGEIISGDKKAIVKFQPVI